MTAKEYFIRHKQLDNDIQCKLEEAASLRGIATSISPPSGFGATGGISDKVGKTVAKIIDLENEINDEIDKLVMLKTEIHRLLKPLEDPLQRIVLERKFILNESLETIAEKIGYSLPQVKRIYKKAKENLEKMIPDDTK